MNRHQLSVLWHFKHTGFYFAWVSLFCAVASFLISFYLSLNFGSIGVDHFILHLGLIIGSLAIIVFVISCLLGFASDFILSGIAIHYINLEDKLLTLQSLKRKR